MKFRDVVKLFGFCWLLSGNLSCSTIRTGSFIFQGVKGVEVVGDVAYVLLSLEYVDYESSVYGHSSHHTTKKTEVYLLETDLTVLLDVSERIVFKKIGEFSGEIVRLDLVVDEGVSMLSRGRRLDCTSYNGPCKKVLVERSRKELSTESYEARNVDLLYEGQSIEIGIELSKKNHLMFIYDGAQDESVMKKFELEDEEITPLSLVILESNGIQEKTGL